MAFWGRKKSLGRDVVEKGEIRGTRENQKRRDDGKKRKGEESHPKSDSSSWIVPLCLKSVQPSTGSMTPLCKKDRNLGSPPGCLCCKGVGSRVSLNCLRGMGQID